jgi:hypothetical protein
MKKELKKVKDKLIFNQAFFLLFLHFLLLLSHLSYIKLKFLEIVQK